MIATITILASSPEGGRAVIALDGLPEWVGPALADRVEAALYDAYVAQVAA